MPLLMLASVTGFVAITGIGFETGKYKIRGALIYQPPERGRGRHQDQPDLELGTLLQGEAKADSNSYAKLSAS